MSETGSEKKKGINKVLLGGLILYGCAAAVACSLFLAFFYRTIVDAREARGEVIGERETEAAQLVERREVAGQTLLEGSGWPVYIAEDFSELSFIWGRGETDDDLLTGSKAFEEGKYIWDVHANDGFIWWEIPRSDSVESFYVKIEGSIISEHPAAELGIIFRYQDGDNFYFMSISNSGSYYIYELIEDEWDAISSGYFGAPVSNEAQNKIEIVAKGSKFWIYVNGDYLIEFEDDTFLDGHVGLISRMRAADQDAVFQFDNFELRTPRRDVSQNAGTTATPVENDWRRIYFEDFQGVINDVDYPVGVETVDGFAVDRSITGEYNWKLSSDEPGAVALALPVELPENFSLSMDARYSFLVPKKSYGLRFREEDGDYYHVLISNQRTYMVSVVIDGEETVLIDWTQASTIKQTAINTLTIIGEGSDYTLMINGEALDEFSDDRITGEGASLVIVHYAGFDNGFFQFDNIELLERNLSEE